MPATCFACGEIGHVVAACPYREQEINPGGKPWCGVCDPRTNLVGTPGGIQRCTDCHPLRLERLHQFRRCTSCRMLVHEWDTAPCGSHSARGAQERKPPIERIQEITRRTE
jgi:Zinc knuckle